MSQRVTDESFVTLATNENYALGALTLAQSLRQANTTRQLTVLITSELSQSLQSHLRSVFDHVVLVDVLNSNDTANLALLKRPELGITFTKLHCWRLTQFSKAVFLDADCVVLQNVDELFEREEFSASTDVGWPDCFNSGVFVFRPSQETYANLLRFATEQGSFDGGDQGLLNAYFSDWATRDASKRLPFIYNMTTNVSYSYAPAFKQFRDSVKIVHFIGAQKPWYYSYNLDTQTVTGNVQNYEVDHLNVWWHLFAAHVLPSLNNETRYRMSSQLISRQPQSQQVEQGWNQPVSHFTQQSNGQQQNQDQGLQIGSAQHQSLWEQGHIEYTGRDSFSNIQAHLDSQLKK